MENVGTDVRPLGVFLQKVKVRVRDLMRVGYPREDSRLHDGISLSFLMEN